MHRFAFASATLASIALAAAGCGLHKKGSTSPASPTSYSYSATASAGDYVSITIDEIAHTLSWNNVSTGDVGTGHFTVASDGSYLITSDTGTMDPVKAYEIPGYALVMKANNTGSAHEASIITAVHSETVAPADMTGNYNYMQFRTNNGGVEIGDVAIGSGAVVPNSYGPYNAFTNQSGRNTNSSDSGYAPAVGFQESSMATSGLVASSDGAYLTLDEGGGNHSYIFRTTGGFFAVDTPNGGLVCLQKAGTKDFIVGNQGQYKSMVYHRSGARMVFDASHTPTNYETAAATSIAEWGIRVSSTGQVTVTDDTSATVVPQNTLQAFEDVAGLHGTTKVKDACHGAFTVHILASGPNDAADVYVIFLTDSLLISSFTGHADGSYDYWYGVGLRDATSGG